MSELLQLDNVVCTPHLGYVERDSFEGQFAEIFDQILAWERGAPVNVVNPEALRPDRSIPAGRPGGPAAR
jgi:D-3-phosphoglycerate dehydrogenase